MYIRSPTLLLLALTASTAAAFSSSSGFAGSQVVFAPVAARPQHSQCRNNMEMKKGKPNVPANMRSQYKRQQEMGRMKNEMMAAQRPGSDGFPVFNLFVRTTRANMWYPCGSFKGDERSAALAQSFRDGGMLSGISKKQLDGGVANSLAQDESKLAETIARAYPQLRKSINEFEYGYKLAYDGLSEEQTTVNVIVPKKRDGGFLDGVKNLFD